MAEGEPTNQNPPANANLASKEDVATAVEKTKTKTAKNPIVKLPTNFLKVIEEIGITLKDIKLVNSKLEGAIANYSKLSKPELPVADKTEKKEIPTAPDVVPLKTVEAEVQPDVMPLKTVEAEVQPKLTPLRTVEAEVQPIKQTKQPTSTSEQSPNLLKLSTFLTENIKSIFSKFNLPGLKPTTTAIAQPRSTIEEDTGAAVLKKEEPKPVVITDFEDDALKTQQEFYKKEPLPVKLIEIEDKLLSKIEKLFEKLGKGNAGKESGGFFKTILNAVKSMGPALKSLGTGLGKGFEMLGKGIGGGIAAIGKGIGGFLAGFGVGLKPLAAGLQTLANPKVAIGLGLVILAINGIALALRIAEPAIKAIVPLFEKIAEVIGGVFMKAIETVGEVLKTFVKEIPNMIRAVGDAIGSILEKAGPALIELAKIVGDVVVKVIKEVRPVIEALIPAFVSLVKIVKEGVIETLKILSPIVTKIIDGYVALGNVIEKVLIAAIEALAPVLKGIIPFLDNVVNKVAEFASKFFDTFDNVINKITEFGTKYLDTFNNLINKVSQVITVGMEKTESIVKSIGSTILGIIEKTGEAVTNVLTTVTDSISRLADIGFVKLSGVAAGIAAIATSIGLFGAGSAAAGISKFFGDVASRATGSKTPFEQILTLAEQATNIKTVASTITDLANALTGFSKIKITEINFGGLVISFNKAAKDLDKTGVDVFANIATGIDKLTTGQESIDTTADSIDKLAEAFLKFNNLDIDKLKEITQLPLKKMAAVATAATMATTIAVASPQPSVNIEEEPVYQTATVEKPTTTTAEPKEDIIEPAATIAEKAEKPSLVETAVTKTIKEPKEDISLFSKFAPTVTPSIQGEFGVNTAPMLPIDAVAKATPELTIIADKLEKLIQSLQPLLTQKENSKIIDNTSTSTITNATTVGGSTNTTIYANSVDRDIPFIERNKYREQYLYNRGLI